MQLPDIEKMAKDIYNYQRNDDLDASYRVDWSEQPGVLQRNKVDFIHDVNVTYEFSVAELGLEGTQPMLNQRRTKIDTLKAAIEEALYLYYLHGENNFDFKAIVMQVRSTLRHIIRRGSLIPYVSNNPHDLHAKEELATFERAEIAHKEARNGFRRYCELATQLGRNRAVVALREEYANALTSRMKEYELDGSMTGGIIGGDGLFETQQFALKGDNLSMASDDDLKNSELDAHVCPRDRDVRKVTEADTLNFERRLGHQAKGKRTKHFTEKRKRDIVEARRKDMEQKAVDSYELKFL